MYFVMFHLKVHSWFGTKYGIISVMDKKKLMVNPKEASQPSDETYFSSSL